MQSQGLTIKALLAIAFGLLSFLFILLSILSLPDSPKTAPTPSFTR